MSKVAPKAFAALPFRLSVSCEAAFVHGAWRRAERELLASVKEGGRVVLSGVPGTGKTMLLQSVAKTLRDHGQTVHLLRHGDPVLAADADDVLLIDEADGLPPEHMRQICALPNAVVLAGLPTLRAQLEASIGLVGRVNLEPLTLEDVARYVAERLSMAGRSCLLFTPEALVALARHSGGLFRVVIILAGAALFFAELRKAGTVTVADVDEAAAMRASVAAEEAVASAAAALPAPAPRPMAVPMDSLQRVSPGHPASWSRRTGVATFAGLAVIWLLGHPGANDRFANAVQREVAPSSATPAGSLPSELPRNPVLSPKHALSRFAWRS